MYFCVLFSLASSFKVKGNWKDSSLEEEKAFLLKSVLESLQNFPDPKKYNDLNQIMQDHISKIVDLGVKYRIGNPAASLKKESTENPNLLGYSILIESDPFKYSTNNIQWKLLNKIYQSNLTNEEKFQSFKLFSHNFSKNARGLIDQEINQTMIDRYIKDHALNDQAIFSINGRKSKLFDPVNVISILLEETNTYLALMHTKLSKHSIDWLLHSPVYRKTIPFIPMMDLTRGATIKSVVEEDYANLWPKHVTNNNSNILQVKQNLIIVQLFAELNSKSKRYLELIIDELKLPKYVSVSVYPIFHIGNPVERKAAFAFYHILDTLSCREAIKFLINSNTKGFEHSYNHFKTGILWKDLEKIMIPGYSDYENVDILSKYLTTHIINETTLLVNGIKSSHLPTSYLFTDIQDDWKDMIEESVMNGNINFTIQEYLVNNTLLVTSFDDPALSIEGEFHNLTYESLIGYSKILKSSNHSSLPIFIFTNQDINSYTNIDYQIYHISLNSRFQKECVIIGGQLISFIPDAKSLDLLIRKHLFNYFHDFEGLTEEESFFISCWRCKQHRNHISRVHHIKANDSFTLSFGTGFVDCEIIVDPMSEDFQTVAFTVEEIKNVVCIKLFPQVRDDAIKKLPSHLLMDFYPNYNNDYPKKKFKIIAPKNWIIEPSGTDFIVNRIAFKGYSKSDKVQIGDQIKTTRNSGKFVMTLPIGVFNTNDKHQKEFIMNFLNLRTIIIENTSQITIPKKKEQLNILTKIVSTNDEELMIQMIKTVQKLSSIPIKFWLSGHFTKLSPPKAEIEYIPQIFDEVFYVDLDLMLPSYVSKVLYCTSNTIWKDDPAKIVKIDMSSSLMILSERKGLKTDKFNQKRELQLRANRPYHYSSLSYVDLIKWRKQNVHEFLCNLIESYDLKTQNELLNIAQLQLQIITIPEDEMNKVVELYSGSKIYIKEL